MEKPTPITKKTVIKMSDLICARGNFSLKIPFFFLSLITQESLFFLKTTHCVKEKRIYSLLKDRHAKGTRLFHLKRFLRASQHPWGVYLRSNFYWIKKMDALLIFTLLFTWGSNRNKSTFNGSIRLSLKKRLFNYIIKRNWLEPEMGLSF